MENPYSFQIGKAYRIQAASDPKQYLLAALQAERYLAAAQVTTPDGIYWAENPQSASALQKMGLYGGSAGILYFYLKLYQVTREPRFLAIIRQATAYLCKHLDETFPTTVYTLPKDHEKVSLELGILGVAGIGFVLAEVYETFDGEPVEAALKQIADYYLAHTTRTEAGVYWTGSTTMITDTAIILFLLQYQALFPSEAVQRQIKEAGSFFLSQQLLQPDGSVRYAGLECIWEGIKPNFEVGTAGSGFLLARLYEATKEPAYLEAAEKCALFLEHCKVPQRKGALIPFRLDKEQDSLFYLGNCSGPAGTSRLFYLLYRLTGKQQYLDTIYELVDGMEAVGAPEHQSAGLWYNLDFCCGHAGLLQFFASLYQATGEQRFSELVRRTASVLLGEKEETADGAAYWTIALERIHPEQLSQPRGYYLGAAGIAAALLQAYLLETDSFFWKRMIDDPFPEKLRSKEWRIS